MTEKIYFTPRQESAIVRTYLDKMTAWRNTAYASKKHFALVHDLQKMEDEFVQAAANYGRRRGVDYDGWRSLGVSKRVILRFPEVAIDHGTIYGYNSSKCRCTECRAAAAEYKRKRRLERREEGV